ncbi:metallophosphoesterase [Mucilaginibacter sp. PAMB04168]|uniref:metallophosphoesterase n=1 Tax=Mucilaginibacter sp. PAMB04168 TaxID=3138567 RepID=UPI0031F6D3A3
MKHLIIGDLHGKDVWQEININLYDKIVFVGDYVDHWTLPDSTIRLNLENIIKLKRKYMDKVELLLGNHDVQYLHYPLYLCSGFRPTMQRSLSFLFRKNSELFKVAYQQGNTIISHAGITNKWFSEFKSFRLVQQLQDEQNPVADLLNKIERTAHRWILHQAGSSRGGEGPGGVTWADRKELMADMLDGYHQIVGHTLVPEPEIVNEVGKSATFIDVLDKITYFHEVDL